MGCSGVESIRRTDPRGRSPLVASTSGQRSCLVSRTRLCASVCISEQSFFRAHFLTMSTVMSSRITLFLHRVLGFSSLISARQHHCFPGATTLCGSFLGDTALCRVELVIIFRLKS